MTGQKLRWGRGVAAAALAWMTAGESLGQESPVLAPLPPLVVTPPVPPQRIEPTQPVAPPNVPTQPVAPVRETAPQPRIGAAPVRVVTARPVALTKKPAIAEIIATGPKAVDAMVSLTGALADAKAAYSKVRDYSGHILIQERSQGQVQAEQTAEVRVRMKPWSVAVKFIAPSSQVGRELVCVEGRNGGKARVKAAGTYGPLAYASLPISDAKTAVSSRMTLTDTGIGPMIERIDRALAIEAKLRNPVSVTAADFTFAGKTVTRYEISFDRPHALRDAARLVVCIDPETKLPVRLEAYDAPTAGKVEGALREAISFVNLTFNQGLGDAPFER